MVDASLSNKHKHTSYFLDKAIHSQLSGSSADGKNRHAAQYKIRLLPVVGAMTNDDHKQYSFGKRPTLEMSTIKTAVLKNTRLRLLANAAMGRSCFFGFPL